MGGPPATGGSGNRGRAPGQRRRAGGYPARPRPPRPPAGPQRRSARVCATAAAAPTSAGRGHGGRRRRAGLMPPHPTSVPSRRTLPRWRQYRLEVRLMPGALVSAPSAALPRRGTPEFSMIMSFWRSTLHHLKRPTVTPPPSPRPRPQPQCPALPSISSLLHGPAPSGRSVSPPTSHLRPARQPWLRPTRGSQP